MCVCIAVLRVCSSFRLEDGNVVVDLGSVLLRHALCDPDDVAAFLFLQLQVGVEHTKVELLNEGEHVQFHLEASNRYDYYYYSKKIWLFDECNQTQ